MKLGTILSGAIFSYTRFYVVPPKEKPASFPEWNRFPISSSLFFKSLESGEKKKSLEIRCLLFFCLPSRFPFSHPSLRFTIMFRRSPFSVQWKPSKSEITVRVIWWLPRELPLLRSRFYRTVDFGPFIRRSARCTV